MYQALYRKYRPKNFDDVVGQKYITKTLKNSIINNKISHAYMLFGPRGIGKTTIAKIFSRAINCENSVDGNPCEKCNSCLKSKELSNIDIIEIDAASNNGVDEIRELKSKVNIIPSELKYKVYIIDEVHMLTAGAFNALLKTLEEPPEHVVFILATTDPQKVSETIISRCQCYSLKRVSVDSIISRLKYVCEQENISIDESVLNQIAISSNGGLRDALSSLDKISSYKQEYITMDDYLEMNNMISLEEIKKIIDIIFLIDKKNFIIKINQYNNEGKNLIEIINQIIYYLRDELVSYYLNNKSLKYNLEEYQNLANIINEKMFDIKKSLNAKIYIELMILKFMDDINSKKNIKEQIKTNQKFSENILKKDDSEKKNISREIKIEKKSRKKSNSNIDQIMKIRLNNALAKGQKKEKIYCEEEIKKLDKFVFDQKIGYLVSELLNAEVRVASQDIVILSYEYESVVNQNLTELDKISNILKEYTGISKKIGIITNNLWEKEKEKYIKSVKNNEKYDIIEEPELILEEIEEKTTTSSLDDFGDIVEIK